METWGWGAAMLSRAQEKQHKYLLDQVPLVEICSSGP